ncbi:Uncharacterized protein APZ42_013785 [Daphnia magna]|uniref:Reverse transcriptase domain-containing protein n=1 Tax=Daphnia magna TaxID=35525 RepID=A0A162QHR3_9CRUS|nr:Uncharacterized protein APZ42_013785 [Daphnia magna]
MNAVKEIFSSATLKLCLFYALATVDKRLAEAKLRRNVREEIYQKLQETVYASSEEIITDVEEYLCRFGNCSFERLSEFRMGKWVVINDESPIKHLAEVRCVVSKMPQLVFEHTLVPFTCESQSSQDFKGILNSTPIQNKNSSRTRPPFLEDSNSETLMDATALKLLNTNSLDSDHLSREHKNKEYCRIDTSAYKLPTFFGTVLTKKMNDSKPLLSENEYKAIYRTSADSIETQTLHPHPNSIRFVAAKFPNLIIDKKDSALTNGIFYLKLKRIMEYKRRVSHQQFSSKGGRVKHRSSDNHGPAAKKSKGIEQDADEDAIEAVDMASYAENVKTILHVCRNFGSSQSIKALYLITFEGRRREILANKFGNNADILQRACPVFNQSAYLQHEFELIKGKGICNTFTNNWTIMFLRNAHRGVYKGSKLRVVFYAFAPFRGKSLNDAIISGPAMQAALAAVISLFQQEKITWASDIDAMFSRSPLENEDADYFCFLWRDKKADKATVYRMDKLPFGASCLPLVPIYRIHQIVQNAGVAEHIVAHATYCPQNLPRKSARYLHGGFRLFAHFLTIVLVDPSMDSSKEKVIFSGEPDMTIFSDASMIGRGVVVNGITTRVPWSTEDGSRHINKLELLSAFSPSSPLPKRHPKYSSRYK